MKYIFYVICQTASLPMNKLEILKPELPFGNSVVFQVDELSTTMKMLLQYLSSLLPNACVQYLSEDTEQDISHEDRHFLFALERTGIEISVKRDNAIGRSFYARRRRHQLRIKDADYVLIVYDEMSTEIRNAIHYAEKNAIKYKIICCAE